MLQITKTTSEIINVQRNPWRHKYPVRECRDSLGRVEVNLKEEMTETEEAIDGIIGTGCRYVVVMLLCV